MQKTDVNTTLAIFFVASALVLIGGLVTVTQQAAFAEPSNADLVGICHVSPGNPDEQHHITASGASAVRAHLAHGDYLGECVGESPPL